MRSFGKVNQMITFLLAAAVSLAAEPSHTLASERSSIESTYELTKYLEYQLKEIKDVYLTYLGPPFNEKDFTPPRPNSTALTLPSAATKVKQWHELENQARLVQNQRAYSILLAAVRELARSTLCPSLKISLLHFCTGLDGLLGSISALMTSLGYSSPPQSVNVGGNAGERHSLQRGPGAIQPASLMSPRPYRSISRSGQRSSQRRSGTKGTRGEREDSISVGAMDKRRGRDGRRSEPTTPQRSGRLKGKGERVRREKREELAWTLEEEQHRQVEGKGRRRLLNIEEDEGEKDREHEIKVELSYLSSGGVITQKETYNNQYKFNSKSHNRDTLQGDGFSLGRNTELIHQEKQTNIDSSSSSFDVHHRPPRSLLPPTLPPPLSTLSLLYQLEAGEEHTLLPQTVPPSLQRSTSLLSPPLSPLLSSSTTSASSSLLSVRPTMNDFSRKVEGFWILRELQSWLVRSAKEFSCLKKAIRG
ncbi:uncharacterized protein clcf1 [Nothobranchius furzeri]|uniref:Cardiotrophin-like cytokine factor 1 n=2 Tax=Nothobranchius furzeri TaxID=105023 RepID=A0A1A8ALR9_NOTFU|nr:uncharacterized protein clcf1 [Nothobranchius furzeri]KAF7228237.1 cardiotrophin-like cytokine factor 1 [Nothobranchius furzeri]